MSEPLGRGPLRDNWWLIAIVVLCVIGAAAFHFRSDPELVEDAAAGQPSLFGGSAATADWEQAQAERSREAARNTITEYERIYAENPRAEDAPAYLFSVGNLQRQRFQNYAEAIRIYELLLTEHPDWEGTHRVFPQLISCYEQIGDRRGMQWVCDLMMRTFPEGSEEYLFAQEKRNSL